jgi:hypothetical protein
VTEQSGYLLTRRPSNIVSKILTKTVNASANEILASSDVTIESKKALRIYAFFNLLTFMLEVLAIVALQLKWIGNFQIFVLHASTNNLPLVPVYVNNYFFEIGWMVALGLQFIFVLRGLPFMRPGTHYVNCLLLKIKFWFIVLCLLMALSLISFSYTADTKISYFVMIPLASLLLLKCKF